MRQISALTIALTIFLAGVTGTPLSHAAARSTMKKTATRVQRDLIDINHASVEELKALPGIHEALAAKIVKNRPYANKTQLSSKGVLSAAEYQKIRPLVIAKQ